MRALTTSVEIRLIFMVGCRLRCDANTNRSRQRTPRHAWGRAVVVSGEYCRNPAWLYTAKYLVMRGRAAYNTPHGLGSRASQIRRAGDVACARHGQPALHPGNHGERRF